MRNTKKYIYKLNKIFKSLLLFLRYIIHYISYNKLIKIKYKLQMALLDF